jgi:hypothetical protein
MLQKIILFVLYVIPYQCELQEPHTAVALQTVRMGTRKDHPVGSPDKRGDKKGKIEEGEMAIVEVEGMLWGRRARRTIRG